MMMQTVMVLHIISEYLGNPSSGRALRGDMKCSSNKQTTAQSHFQSQILDEVSLENIKKSKQKMKQTRAQSQVIIPS